MNLFTKIFIIMLLSFSILISCDNQKAGTFAVKFSWAKDGEGKEVKPDVSTGDFFVTVRIYEWKEGVAFPGDIAANGKQLIQSDPAQMKAKGTSIDFGDLSYGSRRFVVAEIRKGEELTGGILFTGMSQLFDFKAGHHTEVNVEMSMTGLPGYDENGNNTFKIWVFHNDSAAQRVPESRVALRFTIRNANSVIIANDLNFEKGTAEIALTDLKKIDETTYEYSPWNFTTGWEEIGDGSYTVFGKLKNNIGQIGEPKRADVFLDTTPPVPNITPFKEVAKLGDRIEVRILFDEAVDPESLVPGWQGLPFVLEENKEDKSFVYTYTVQEEDNEIEYQFSLTAADVVGNKTDVVDLGKVRIDTTPPDLNYIAMFKNGTEHGLSSNLYLKHGDILRFELELNEEITEIPQLLLGPHKIICEEGEKELSFDCSLTIDKDVTYDVVADISLSFNDIAGNIYSRSIVSGAKIDTQVPQFIFRKNKDPQDYNATDTIVLTITANEPVETITVDDIELNNMFTSWNIEGKNETGTHEVKLKAVDLAGNEQTEFTVGTYKVDAKYPEAVISLPNPARISGSGSSVISVTEAKKPIQSIKLNGVECSVAYCTFNAPSGSGDSIESLTVTLTDFAGNISNISAGTVYVDRTKPEISGDATIIFTKPAGCPLGSVNSITSGSSVDISFIVNEPLKEIGDPLVSAEGEVNIIDFNMTGQIGYFYTFSKETINTEFLTDGTYIFKIEIEDEVGNKNNITLTGGFEIDTAKPDAPFVDEEERIVYRRIPWGSDETGGIKYFSIKADGNAVDENTSWVYAYDGSDPSTASEIGKTAASGGTFSEFELNRSDRTEVYLAAYDNACNRSDAVKVRDVEWTATMGGKVPGSTWENPNSFEQCEWFSGPLLQSGAGVKETNDSFTKTAGSAKWFSLSSGVPSSADSKIVYDNERGVVVFLGIGENKIWEWNGVSWKSVIPSDPEGDGNPQLYDFGNGVYDSIESKVVVFSENDLWAWNGNSWKKHIPEDHENDGNPSISWGYSIAYDTKRGILVLFGGYHNNSYTNETWEWNGINWEKKTSPDPEGDGNPSNRAGHSMAYDSVRGKTVLFGGYQYNNETWEWNGISWKKMIPDDPEGDGNPLGRNGHAMIFDQSRSVVVLYGGHTSNGIYSGDTWEWNGISWKNIAVIDPENDGYPSGKYRPSLAYDPFKQRSFLWGGIESFPKGGLWEWNGLSWKRNDNVDIYGDGEPSNRTLTAMVFDSNRSVFVLFGGKQTHPLNDTWEWDGKDWKEIFPIDNEGDGNPSNRFDLHMAYDSIRSKVVLFGGSDGGDTGPLNDTWEYNGLSWEMKTPTDIEGDGDPQDVLSMTYNAKNGKIVLLDKDCNIWEWDGFSWIYVNLVDPEEDGNPLTCDANSMIYDPQREKLILVGGDVSGDLCTWEGDGISWEKISCFVVAEDYGRGFLFYDTLIEKVVSFSGEAHVYELNGNYWEKIGVSDPESDGVPLNSAIASDMNQGRVIAFSQSSEGKTWIWDGGSNSQPSHILKVFLSSAISSKTLMWNSINVFFRSGGIGYPSGIETSGTELKVWDEGVWKTVDDNNMSPADLENDPESGRLEWTTTDPLVLNRIFFGDQKTLNFAVTPVAPNGTGTGVIATDYAEVIVRYTITD